MSADWMEAVAAALRMVGADGVAVGVTTGDTAVLWSVGSVDGEPPSEQTVMYGAPLAKQVVGLLQAEAVDTWGISAVDRLNHVASRIAGLAGRDSVASLAAPYVWTSRR